MKIAVIDSGIHEGHPHVGRIAGAVHFTADGVGGDPVDRLGHGTAVAGAIREKVPEADLFTSVSALLAYILGASGQNATNAATARTLPDTNRTDFLTTVSTRWANLDPDEYPFTRRIAQQLPGHDDREQFLAGIDLILAGIETMTRAQADKPAQ